MRTYCPTCEVIHENPALWAVQSGLAKPPQCSPMWVRRGKAAAISTLSRMYDQLTLPKT